MLRARPLVAISMALAALGCSGGETPGADGAADPIAPEDGGVATDAARADVGARADDAAPVGCCEFEGKTSFTCSKDGDRRGKCVAGAPVVEACARGCLIEASGDDVCMGTTATLSCNGTFGTEKAQDGDYYITAFGCWVDANKVVHTDPGDNCIPGCLSKAQQSLCKNMSGPQCEETVDWFVADSGRFGCLARLRVENPKNGKKAIVVALDAGPACWVEQKAGKALLDASGRVNEYLFGTQHGWSDKALVHVVEVDPSTPLGPVP